MVRNNGTGGARCVNLSLFVLTIMFIIESSNKVTNLKKEMNLATNEEYKMHLNHLYTCRLQVMTWIAISFFNYYSFIFFCFWLYSLKEDLP